MSKINLLILGSGIQEHVLAKKAKDSPLVEHVYMIPGNQRMFPVAEQIDVDTANYSKLLKFIKQANISLVFIGYSHFLHDELISFLQETKIPTIAPQKEICSLLENRVNLYSLLRPHKIPLPTFHFFESIDGAIQFSENARFPLVLKTEKRKMASKVCYNQEDVREYLSMVLGKNSPEQEKIIVEEFISDTIVSFSALIIQNEIMIFPPCHSFKEGQVSAAIIPSHFEFPKTQYNIERLIIVPLVHAINGIVSNYQGIVSLDIALTAKGPYLIECEDNWNPILAQIWMNNLKSDIVELLLAFYNKQILDAKTQWVESTIATLLPIPSFLENEVERIVQAHENTVESGSIFFHSANHSKKEETSFLGLTFSGQNLSKACKNLSQFWDKMTPIVNSDLDRAMGRILQKALSLYAPKVRRNSR